jgi:pectate lyase
MPAVWDAANLTFQVSMDNVTYLNAYDVTGAEEVVTVTAASTHIWVHPNDLAGYRWVKVRSGTSGLPVVQDTGDDPRLLELITRGVG